jgi:hypothetical protein
MQGNLHTRCAELAFSATDARSRPVVPPLLRPLTSADAPADVACTQIARAQAGQQTASHGLRRRIATHTSRIGALPRQSLDNVCR